MVMPSLRMLSGYHPADGRFLMIKYWSSNDTALGPHRAYLCEKGWGWALDGRAAPAFSLVPTGVVISRMTYVSHSALGDVNMFCCTITF